MKWEPIETAPKDGTDVLLCFMNNPRTAYPIITVGLYEPSYHEWDVEGWTAGKLADDMGIGPTHWMSLPEPPIKERIS